ncbi:sialate O-acetylesterase [Arachidicoccus sp.]|uniref:sialate O-acetylesterase n=1 Tax=Arachidicoccus sp. TaxID=1872624 RepID=UPI003D225E73
MKKCLFIFIGLFLLGQSQAQIRLPNILSSGMVLQQKADVSLWGWANPTDKISITTSWNEDTLKTKANGNGKWQITIHTPKAGGPYIISFKSHNTIIKLNDVWLGEVWVCSGQSNMEFTYNWRKTKDVAADFATCNKYRLHFFQIPKTTAKTPQENCDGSWTNCDSNTVKNFSAVAYFFGKKLSENLNVPIGLISSNWGGTPAEVWTPDSVIDNNKFLKEWQKRIKPTPWWPTESGLAYNAMIAPITKYKIAGTIWYQGESNVDTYQSYAPLFKSMISSWRNAWDEEFPFYFVQIAPYKYGTFNVGAHIRQAQTEALSLPKTGMVVTSDLVTDTNDIHPHDKHDVGYRLAEIALHDNYDLKQFDNFSPLYQSYTLKGNRVEINLSNANEGLHSKNGDAKDLYIAGEDGIFYPAKVKLGKGSITVYNANIATPKIVEYGFNNTQMGNIFNKGDMPVAPFKIDIQ